MWTVYFIEIKTILVGGSCSAQCMTAFWFNLIICEFLMKCSTSLRVEGQQQRSDSNLNTSGLFAPSLVQYHQRNLESSNVLLGLKTITLLCDSALPVLQLLTFCAGFVIKM